MAASRVKFWSTIWPISSRYAFIAPMKPRSFCCFILQATLLFVFSAKATNVSQKTETANDIIEKCYTLSLQKERSQAILILVNAIKRESKKNPKAAKDLAKALDQISTVFYSDKAQQLYELGVSLRLNDPALANQKLTDALKLEPDHLRILLAQIRVSTELGDCSSALSQAKKIKEINPFSEEVDLSISQAAVCSGQFDSYQQLKPAIDDRKNPLGVHWATVELEYQFKAGNFGRALELSKGLQKLDPLFPEAHYWEWKVQVELKEKAEPSASKYMNLCKSLSARAQRKYMTEPFLCRRTTEVETFLKKNNNLNL
jgi:hypothetical protein